jgi:mannose-1-phosphate guanylyltransferase
MHEQHTWAIVLAAGDGTRLGFLTDADGRPVPKQFWSLRGERSLLGDALDRARRIAGNERTLVVVAEKHRALWQNELHELPAANIVVQPRNCGTAAGVLLPLLTIMSRDTAARVVMLPSDHHIDDDAVLEAALNDALGAMSRDNRSVVLLGVTPEDPETGYGWIVPAHDRSATARVERFVEKPSHAVARELMAQGGLWNSFIMAFEARGMIDLFEQRLPELVEQMRVALADGGNEALGRLYEHLEVRDLSRDLMQGYERALSVLPVPQCGWTDLGTPERLVACLTELGRSTRLDVAVRGRFSLFHALRRFRVGVPAVAGAGAA